MKKEIILKSMGYFNFNSDKKLKNLVKSYGYEDIFDLEARMDLRIIKYLKDVTNNRDSKNVQYQSCRDGNAHLYIDEVDTSRMWLIDNYDSGESIVYLELENKDLNLYTYKYD